MTGHQNTAVLDWLRRYPSITPLEAMNKLGIMRLGARIYDLRQAGHDIEREMIEVSTRDGTTHVARYRLISEARKAA